jgi:hypothetical protein
MVTDDRLIDLAEEYGMRAAGRYLRRFGRYPTGDDTDDFGDVAWDAAWGELERRGAVDGLMDAAFEAWHSGYLGPNA